MTPEAWLDLVLKRARELRGAGVLSVGIDTCSVVLAPFDPAAESDDAKSTDDARAEPDEPVNPYDNPASYPTGHAPTIDVEELPEIPDFKDDV